MNIKAILEDKVVRIGGYILGSIIAITILASLFGLNSDGGLIILSIISSGVFFNLIVYRHPIMSFKWLYGIDLGLTTFLLFGALAAADDSGLARLLILVLLPLNIWLGFLISRELRRTALLRGKFIPSAEGGLTLEFSDDGTLILSSGKYYRFSTRRNDLFLYDGDALAAKWEIVKCDLKALMVKDDQGMLHDYKRDFSAVKSVASSVLSGIAATRKAFSKMTDRSLLIEQWTPQNDSLPSIQFTHDNAFVSSDGKAGRYSVDWDLKTITVVLADGTPLLFQIIALAPKQLILSRDGVATTYSTTMSNRLFGMK